MIPRQEHYFNPSSYAQEVFDFTGKSLEYFKSHFNEALKNRGTIVDNTRDIFSQEELININNHFIINTIAYVRGVHPDYCIDSHLNSPSRVWMKRFKDFFSPGKRILDHGCGDCTNALTFYDMGYDVVSIDLPIDWIKFIEFRCKKYSVNIDFRYTHNNHDFIKDNEQFDVLFSHEVLEHIKNPEEVVAYMIQHLKSGALAFISTFFTAGDLHLKENRDKFGLIDAKHSPEFEKILFELGLQKIEQDFYVKL